MRSRPPASAMACEELVSAHLDALYRTALRLCSGHSHDAEDLLQDAMLRAFAKHRDLREPAAARSWLFTILVRTNRNRLRRDRRRRERLSTDMDEQAFAFVGNLPPSRLERFAQECIEQARAA